jgi:HlyD family secretion protein
VDQLLAQKARLEAEQMGADHIAFSETLGARTSETARKAIANERQLFATRRSEQVGQTAQLRARIGQYREQIDGYRAQISALQEQIKLIEPERDGVRSLYEQKLVTLGRLNQLERTASDLKGSVGALRAQIAATEARISETREQLLHLGESWRSAAGTELAQVNAQLNLQQARSASASDLHDRSTIYAPYDGVVEGLAFATIGGVVRPAEDIMQIVPDQDRLVVEGAVGPEDIDQIFVNQTARVRITALNRSTTPELTAKVSYVGTNRVTEQAGDASRSYFPVRLTIDAKDLAANRQVILKTGMPVEIYIETGSRSMLSFVTKPLRDQFARAFRSD